MNSLHSSAKANRDEQEYEKWFQETDAVSGRGGYSAWDHAIMLGAYKAALAAERARSKVLVEALEEIKDEAVSDFWAKVIDKALTEYNKLTGGGE